MIIEDGFFLDDDTKRVLEDSGAILTVVNWIDADKALSEQSDFDGVIIDINVEADAAFAVAERAGALKIPFVFALPKQQDGPRRFGGYTLCPDPDELAGIGSGLFGGPQLN